MAANGVYLIRHFRSLRQLPQNSISIHMMKDWNVVFLIIAAIPHAIVSRVKRWVARGRRQ
jgi:hypothetical protein